MSFGDSNQTAAVKSSFDILYGAIPPHITKLRGRRLQRAFGTLYSEMCEPEGEQEGEQEEMPEPPAGLWFLLLGWRSIVWLLAAALFLLATATGAACWLSGGPLHHSMRELSNERCE